MWILVSTWVFTQQIISLFSGKKCFLEMKQKAFRVLFLLSSKTALPFLVIVYQTKEMGAEP